MAERLTPLEERILRKTLARANEQGWGIAFGLVSGIGLFLATVVLVVGGGPNPGSHLGLLRAYFPGYSVTWIGSFIGFVYAFVGGYAMPPRVAAASALRRRLGAPASEADAKNDQGKRRD